MANVVLARCAWQQLLDLDWLLIDAVEEALGLVERDPHVGHALRGRLQAFDTPGVLLSDSAYYRSASALATAPVAQGL